MVNSPVKMSLKFFLLVGLILFAYNVIQVTSKFELTNINCTSVDEAFCGFEYCYLKSVNRTYKYLFVKANLYKIPITKVKLNFAVLKRLNGYKPFLYNVTFDACNYLKSKNQNPVATYFYSIFKDFTNMNHTCPYDHDLIVDKLSIGQLNHYLTKVLPFPEGDYAMYSSWYADGIKRAEVKVYGSLSEF